jgi:hypothetical protein
MGAPCSGGDFPIEIRHQRYSVIIAQKISPASLPCTSAVQSLREARLCRTKASLCFSGFLLAQE